MKFSLKTMLIALCGLGAAVGLLGKLLVEGPENFLNALRFLSTVGPFLLAVGTIIWVGFRSRPRSGLVAWGVALLLTPIVVQAIVLLFWPSGDPLRMLSNWRLITKRLPSQVDAPWVWRELERRISNRDLSQEEVDDAISELTSYMKKAKPTGWNQPLAWQDDFLLAAIQTKMISEDVFLDLCDAFYGPKPRVQPLPALSEDAPGIQLEIDFGNPWSDNSNLGIEMLWDVKKVLLDGSRMKLGQMQEFGEHWSGFAHGKLTAGDHLLTIEVDCAYVDTSALVGVNAAELPMAQWPKARKRWTTTVIVPVKVEAVTVP